MSEYDQFRSLLRMVHRLTFELIEWRQNPPRGEVSALVGRDELPEREMRLLDGLHIAHEHARRWKLPTDPLPLLTALQGGNKALRAAFNTLTCLRSDLNAAEHAPARGSGSRDDELRSVSPDGEWSLPMSKTDMRVRLDNMAPRKFKTWGTRIGIRTAGNRQTFQIRLDAMDRATRLKFEKNK